MEAGMKEEVSSRFPSFLSRPYTALSRSSTQTAETRETDELDNPIASTDPSVVVIGQGLPHQLERQPGRGVHHGQTTDEEGWTGV